MTRIWTLLRGIAALVAITAAVFGLPAALLAVGGSPIPHALPHLADVWDTLTSRDDGTVLLAALRVLAWAGWAMFTVSVLADLLARLRRVPVPRLGPQQAIASQLIAAVAAISVLAPASSTAAAAPPPSISAAQAAESGPLWTGLPVRLAAADHEARATHRPVAAGQLHAHRQHRTWRTYRVRVGDTLWDIADERLGDPLRWPEIYAASLTVDQPDGRRLRDPDLIVPGWTLRVPSVRAHAHAPAPEPAQAQPSVDEQQAARDAETLQTPFGGGERPASVPSALTTPLSTSHSHAGDEDPIVAEDWRGRVRDAVPELG